MAETSASATVRKPMKSRAKTLSGITNQLLYQLSYVGIWPQKIAGNSILREPFAHLREIFTRTK